MQWLKIQRKFPLDVAKNGSRSLGGRNADRRWGAVSPCDDRALARSRSSYRVQRDAQTQPRAIPVRISTTVAIPLAPNATAEKMASAALLCWPNAKAIAVTVPMV